MHKIVRKSYLIFCIYFNNRKDKLFLRKYRSLPFMLQHNALTRTRFQIRDKALII